MISIHDTRVGIDCFFLGDTSAPSWISIHDPRVGIDDARHPAQP